MKQVNSKDPRSIKIDDDLLTFKDVEEEYVLIEEENLDGPSEQYVSTSKQFWSTVVGLDFATNSPMKS